MTTHTPGPWLTSQDAVPDGFIQVTVYAEADGQRVATVFRDRANAELIARAPDLLAALKLATEALWEIGDGCDAPYSRAKEALSVVERRAKG